MTAGVTFTITNDDSHLRLGYRMTGDGGLSQRTVEPTIVDDLRTVLKWSTTDPGEYVLELTHNPQGELAFQRWEPVRRLPRRPAPAAAAPTTAPSAPAVDHAAAPDAAPDPNAVAVESDPCP